MLQVDHTIALHAPSQGRLGQILLGLSYVILVSCTVVGGRLGLRTTLKHGLEGRLLLACRILASELLESVRWATAAMKDEQGLKDKLTQSIRCCCV